MTNPKLSVILPFYNCEAYLAESLDSVLKQSYEDFEIILIDDGSTDNSLSIVKSFRDGRIRLYRHRQNNGLVKALNFGLKRSRGQYIARMDADDKCYLDRFQIQVDFMELNRHVDILSSGIRLYENDRIRGYDYGTEYLKIALLFDNPIFHPAVMLRKDSVLLNRLKYDTNALYVEDYKLWIDCMLSGLQIRCSSKPVLRYRQHKHQITKTKRAKQFANFLIVSQMYAKVLFSEVAGLNNMEAFSPLISNYVDNEMQSSKCIKLIEDLIINNQKHGALNIPIFTKVMEYKKKEIEKYSFSNPSDIRNL